MENTQNSQNNVINEILINILKELYFYFSDDKMSDSLDVIMFFDDMQRVSKFDNLTIGGHPKVPPFELCERINVLASQINKLPKKSKLEKCKFSVKPGGYMDITPEYKQS